MDVKEAFKALHTALKDELETVKREGAANFNALNMDKIHQSTKKIEKIRGIEKALKGLEKQFSETMHAKDHPPVDAGGERMAAGTLTPYDRYWIPILTALVERDGRAATHEVVDRVAELMVGVLNNEDRGFTATQNEPRWRNRARWARKAMVEAGLLNAHTARGYWEISEQGREYLKNRV